MHCDETPAGGACGSLTTERLRYFTGRHMTARDFEDEQSYHTSHRHLHNRMLHGWGIVCGLEVRPHPKPECRTQRVLVHCGMAIDCCGREILVRHDAVTDPIPWTERPRIAAGAAEAPDPDAVLLLCLEYCEAPTEKVPVLYNEQACASPSMEDGRTREGARFRWHWVKRGDLASYGWRTHEGCAPEAGDPHHANAHAGHHGSHHHSHHAGHHGADPHAETPDRPCPEMPCHDRRCCLDPDCPEHPCVPLAVLTESGAPNAEPVIDLLGRRPIGEARGQLTHICWVSWPHGGLMSAGQLASQRRLAVRFDRPIEAVPQPEGACGPRGINPCTFRVEFGEIYEDVDFVPYRRPPYLASDHRTAVFELEDPRPSPTGGFRYLIGHTVYVTIKCDFLLDCEGQAVDGDHIGGRLPTGDGIAGGTFESWFTVVSDDDYEHMTKSTTSMPTP